MTEGTHAQVKAVGGGEPTTRDIARAAVRARLADVAFDLFRREGFDQVTVNEVSAAAGVSRSTFLRYFASKEEAILSAFDAQDALAVEALRTGPTDEDDWTALRRTMSLVLEPFHRAQQDYLPLARMVENTPALSAGRREKQVGWRTALAQALHEREGAAPTAVPPLPLLVHAAAAVECMNIAVARWAASDGGEDLGALLDEAFSALRVR